MEYAGGRDTFRHYLVTASELNTPTILICPQEFDRNRKMATHFGAPPSWAAQTPGVDFASNTNLSYFVGLDARDTVPGSWLAGDRNVTNGMRLRDGVLELTTNRLVRWTGKMHAPTGNVAFADGSVHSLDSKMLPLTLRRSGLETNRLAMPNLF